MTDPRPLLRRANLSPKKSFGQNFLVSDGVQRTIAQACVPNDDVGRAEVIEIGAGLGALTGKLLERARHVLAVERDRDLIPLLQQEFADPLAAGTLTLLEGDAKALDLRALFGAAAEGTPRVLCGNLPYQITGALLELATHAAGSFDRAIFMVQDEVAERLVAKPSTKAYGALSVFVQAAFRVTRVTKVSPGAFHPPPNVTSSVVLLAPHRPALAEETKRFRALVKGAFAMRRKTLRNAWAHLPEVDAEAAAAAGISLDARGETLDVQAFARLAAGLDARHPS